MNDISEYIKTLNTIASSNNIVFNEECKKIIFNEIPEYKKIYLLVEITNFLNKSKYSFESDEDMNILIY